MSYPRFRRARAVKRVRRATGTNISLTSTAWAEVAAATNGPGTTGFDMTVEAQIGDLLRVGFSGLVGNQASDAYFDFASVVGGVVVTYFAAESTVPLNGGLPAFAGLASQYRYESGDFVTAPLGAGDVSVSTVTVRLQYKLGSATAKTLYSDATTGLVLWVENIGPADPN